MQAYNSVVGDADIISKLCSTSLTAGKKFGSFFSESVSSLTGGVADVKVEKIVEQTENLVNNDKFKKAGEFLNNGGLICFDDFERKSKDIDLNDLFGFISHLTIEFKCKVVIILNEDVFEGEEKKVFSNVKEKTVSKFLNYAPSIDELFDLIYDRDEKYKELDKYRDVILKTIKETEELNARIYIQVLDNLLECKDIFENDIYVVYFIYTNIGFILYHHIFKNKINIGFSGNWISTHLELNYPKELDEYIDKLKYNDIDELIYMIRDTRNFSAHRKEFLVSFVNKRINIFKSLIFLNKKVLLKGLSRSLVLEDFNKNKDKEVNEFLINKINNFIETGILIDEK